MFDYAEIEYYTTSTSIEEQKKIIIFQDVYLIRVNMFYIIIHLLCILLTGFGERLTQKLFSVFHTTLNKIGTELL